REWLQAIGATVGVSAIGCGDGGSSGGGAVGADAGASSPDGSPPPDGAPPDATPDAAPLSQQELLGQIDAIVVLCMENRSFDHYLGSLTLREGRADVLGLTGAETNPDPDGHPVGVYRLEDFT